MEHIHKYKIIEEEEISQGAIRLVEKCEECSHTFTFVGSKNQVRNIKDGQGR